MKIAIVDDSSQEQIMLRKHIEKWAEQNELTVSIVTFDSGEDFCHNKEMDSFDIVFMDILMDGQNGIETARVLRSFSLNTLLIFITSSTEFMAQAFPCHAFDYVIKPYTIDRISQVMNEAKRALNKFGDVIEIASEKFVISEIMYVFSDSNYCDVFTANGRRKVRISFTELSQLLLKYQSFMVVGRGVIVNFDNTSYINGLECVMTNGDTVPVSRRKIKETEQAFMNRQFSRLLSEGK